MILSHKAIVFTDSLSSKYLNNSGKNGKISIVLTYYYLLR